MPVAVDWYNEQQTIILGRLGDPVRYADLIALNEGVADLLDTVDYVVGVIIDYAAVTRIPEAILYNLPDLIVSAPSLNHWNGGLHVVVRVRPSIRLVYDTTLLVYPDLAEQLAFAKSRQEAERILYHSGTLDEG